jgi:hypothetical protein
MPELEELNETPEVSTGANVAPEPSESTASPLAQVSASASKDPDLRGMLKEQVSNLQASRGQKKEIIENATKKLQERLAKQQGGPSAEEYFRLSQGFLSPTKTGSFFESLGNASGVGADILKGRREGNAQLEELINKYQLQGLDVDGNHLKEMIGAVKQLSPPSTGQSAFGKQAMDEGLTPGTPEFGARVRELSQSTLDAKSNKNKPPEEGEFDMKTGNFLTPNGSLIPKAEVTKDRETRQKLIDQKAAFTKIDKKTINKAVSFFDVTGGGTTGALGKAIGSQLSPDTLDAQTKVYNQALEGIMKALPPGPASDKDVQNARATFPGFGSKKALTNWLKSLEEMVDRHIQAQDNKYGSEKWFGAGGAPKAASRNDLGETPAESNRMNKEKAPAAPKAGAILHGHRFKGGDPSKQENWEKV